MKADENSTGFNRNCVKKVQYEPQHNLSLDVPKYSFIPLTTLKEQRLYVRFHSEQYMEEDNEAYIKKLIGKDFVVASFKDILAEATDYVCIPITKFQ